MHIKLSHDEYWPLLNIINEVCHGIRISDFSKTIGIQKKVVIEFLEYILNENKDNELQQTTVTLHLNETEKNFLEKSFEEVFKQIEEWEFHTRIGISIEKAIEIRNKISKQAYS